MSFLGSSLLSNCRRKSRIPRKRVFNYSQEQESSRKRPINTTMTTNDISWDSNEKRESSYSEEEYNRLLQHLLGDPHLSQRIAEDINRSIRDFEHNDDTSTTAVDHIFADLLSEPLRTSKENMAGHNHLPAPIYSIPPVKEIDKKIVALPSQLTANARKLSTKDEEDVDQFLSQLVYE
jgi:hypothetical protein